MRQLSKFTEIFLTIQLLFLGQICSANEIIIEGGPKGGFFDSVAMHLVDQLKSKGVDARLVNREDTVEIIEDVERHVVDIGFAAQDLTGKHFQNVEVLGNIKYEPLLIFTKKDRNIEYLSDLKGLKIANGPDNSGSKVNSERVLHLYGINEINTQFLRYTPKEMLSSINAGKIDAYILLLPFENKIIQEFINNKEFKIVSFADSNAIANKLNYFKEVKLNKGDINILNEVPEQTKSLIALPVSIVNNSALSPYVSSLLAQYLKDEFSSRTVLNDANEFPNTHAESLDQNLASERTYQKGFPRFYNYMPIAIAEILDKIVLSPIKSYLYVGISLLLIFALIYILIYLYRKLKQTDKLIQSKTSAIYQMIEMSEEPMAWFDHEGALLKFNESFEHFLHPIKLFTGITYTQLLKNAVHENLWEGTDTKDLSSEILQQKFELFLNEDQDYKCEGSLYSSWIIQNRILSDKSILTIRKFKPSNVSLFTKINMDKKEPEESNEVTFLIDKVGKNISRSCPI